MCHHAVDIADIRVKPLQLLYKSLYVLFLKIQLTGIILRNDILSQELSPDLFFLKDQPFCQDQVPVIVQNRIQTKRSW